jgi:hypothetical protein
LTGLQHLQFLTLVGQMTDFWVWEWGFRVADILKNSSVTRCLKELTIGFVSHQYIQSTRIDWIWQDILNSKVWKDLDLILSSVSTLQQVLIHFYFSSCNTVPGPFWAGMRDSMPLLQERGILLFKTKGDAHPERDMWTEIEFGCGDFEYGSDRWRELVP